MSNNLTRTYTVQLFVQFVFNGTDEKQAEQQLDELKVVLKLLHKVDPTEVEYELADAGTDELHYRMWVWCTYNTAPAVLQTISTTYKA
jgi:NADH dehydrogenase FAD-containing subunit